MDLIRIIAKLQRKHVYIFNGRERAEDIFFFPGASTYKNTFTDGTIEHVVNK